MKAAFSLGWRLLLVLALVLNPVAAAFAMAVERDGAGATAASADMPPCHEMSEAPTAAPQPATGDDGESAEHGCDCGNQACEFAACCIGGLASSIQFSAVDHTRNHLALPASRDGALPPPPSRLIRPPIA